MFYLVIFSGVKIFSCEKLRFVLGKFVINLLVKISFLGLDSWLCQVDDSFKEVWKHFPFEIFFWVSIRNALFRKFPFWGGSDGCARWMNFPLQISCVKNLDGSILLPCPLALWQKRKRTWYIAHNVDVVNRYNPADINSEQCGQKLDWGICKEWNSVLWKICLATCLRYYVWAWRSSEARQWLWWYV